MQPLSTLLWSALALTIALFLSATHRNLPFAEGASSASHLVVQR